MNAPSSRPLINPASAPPVAARSDRTRPKLYQHLREAIIRTELEPGVGLSETRVGQQHGVSRTPVREAFQRLAEEGLLVVVPQVGSFVAPINLGAVRDSHFVRDALECRLAELAAQRIDATGRKALERSLADQRRAVARKDVDAFFEADEAMHRCLADIAGHPKAWLGIQNAKAQLDRVRRLSLTEPAWTRQRLQEHRAIYSAVLEGKPAEAVRAMRAHLASVFAAIEKIGADHAHYFNDPDALSGTASGPTPGRTPARK